MNKHELQLLQINLPELGFNHDVTVNSIKKHYNNIKNNISKAITYYSSLHKLKDKHKIFNFNSRTSFKFADIPTQKKQLKRVLEGKDSPIDQKITQHPGLMGIVSDTQIRLLYEPIPTMN